MPYTVVYGMSSADLGKKVNAKLTDGWKPVGNLIIHGTTEFYQPMLKGGSSSRRATKKQGRRRRQTRRSRQSSRQATRSRR